MQLERLYLNNFKNNRESKLILSPRINIFVGENGAGKTNILEAIYYLSFCKSPFNPTDKQNIMHNENYFMLRGEYLLKKESKEIVNISFKVGERKKIKRNEKEYDRISDHIGEFPLVMISPSDSKLIYGASEDRRKYIDGVISQFDHNYLHTLLNYNKILQQRNSYLKANANSSTIDHSLLDIFDEKLSIYGEEVHKKRHAFLISFIPLVQNYYLFISNEKERADIRYKSQLKDANFLNLLKNNRQRDLILRHSSIGIHRDDIEFMLNDFPIKRYGSQGQQKSFLIALKIAQFEYTYKKKNYKPLLLLDDIFDKLDIYRVKQLMKLVSRNEFGQIFVTDTNEERIHTIFEKIDVVKNIFMVNQGEIIQIKE